MNPKKQEQQTLTIIWIALMQSHIIFAFIAHFVFAKKETVIDEPLLAYIWIGAAAGSAALAWFINRKAQQGLHRRPIALDPENQKSPPNSNPFPLFLISWVICETISIFGLLIVNFQGAAGLSFANVLFAAGLGLHVLLKPKFRSH